MKIAYITSTDYVGGWAHSVQIVNMCSNLASNGADLTMILPYRSIFSKIDLFEYYKLPRNFKVKKLPCIDLFVGSKSSVFYWLRFISFYISARIYVWFHNFGILYSRDLYSAVFFPSIVLEQHTFPKKINFINKLIFNSKRKAVVLTSFIKSRLVNSGLQDKNVLVSPSGVDLKEFNQGKGKIAISGISDADFVFGYIGTLKTMDMEKGVALGLEALKILPEYVKYLVVGGEESDIKYYKDLAVSLDISSRVVFTGKILHSEIPKYYNRCDIFIAPFPENEHYNYFMSPLKIFEYMASGKPIISTTLPSIKEVLVNDSNAILIKPSDVNALAEAIMKIKVNPDYGAKLAAQALGDVSEYSWNKRAQNILNFIQK